jgi:hypothetical protein
MLLLGIFLLVCALMVAALAIDIGHVQMTRQQMQTAANIAVVEVSRDRNGKDAQKMVRAMFDDDFGATSASRIQYGAGGNVPLYSDTEQGEDLSGGFDASARYYLPDDPYIPSDREPVRLYKPDIALNTGNNDRGDIVVGLYNYAATSHGEQSSYARSDFAPDETGPAALVRLRRTGEALEDSVGVVGDSVPFLFGRANLSAGNSDYWSFIDRGVKVRTTAIADMVPAVSAGWEFSAQSIVGLIGLALPRQGDDVVFNNPIYFSASLSQLTLGMTIDSNGNLPQDGVHIAAVVSDTVPYVVHGFTVVNWDSSTLVATPADPPVGGVINATGVFVMSSDLSQLSEILTWHEELRPDSFSNPPKDGGTAWGQLLKVPVRRRSL